MLIVVIEIRPSGELGAQGVCLICCSLRRRPNVEASLVSNAMAGLLAVAATTALLRRFLVPSRLALKSN